MLLRFQNPISVLVVGSFKNPISALVALVPVAIRL